jgi:hypothetical protein
LNTQQLVVTLLGGAAAGAVLTALTSLFTGWLSRRHDQRRWLLGRRLEAAYVGFNAAVNAWQLAWSGVITREVRNAEALTDAHRQLNDRRDQLCLLAAPATDRKSAEAWAAISAAVRQLGSAEGRINETLIARADHEVVGLRSTLAELLALQRPICRATPLPGRGASGSGCCAHGLVRFVDSHGFFPTSRTSRLRPTRHHDREGAAGREINSRLTVDQLDALTPGYTVPIESATDFDRPPASHRQRGPHGGPTSSFVAVPATRGVPAV